MPFRSQLPDQFRAGRYRRLSATRGGESYVVEAVDELRDEKVALKFHRDILDFSATADLVTVRHPHLVEELDRFHDVGLGRLVRVEPWLEGGSLLDMGEGLEEAQLYLVGTQLMSCLAALHRSGLRHGDVKPANVMLDRSHGGLRSVLIDLGMVARLDDPALPGGTRAYFSPELLRGAAPGPGMDWYALGLGLDQIRSRLDAPRRGVPPETLPSRARIDRLIRDLLCLEPEERCALAQSRLRSIEGVLLPDVLPFVGRETERATLERAVLGQFGCPERRAVHVSGSKGSGRRRLVRESVPDLRRHDCAVVIAEPSASILRVALEAATELGIPLSVARSQLDENVDGIPGIAAVLLRWARARRLVLCFDPEVAKEPETEALVDALLQPPGEKERRGEEASTIAFVSCVPPGRHEAVALRPLEVEDVETLLTATFGTETVDRSVVGRAARAIHGATAGHAGRIDALIRNATHDRVLGFSEGRFHGEPRLLAGYTRPLGSDEAAQRTTDGDALRRVLQRNFGALDRNGLAEILGWDMGRVEDALSGPGQDDLECPACIEHPVVLRRPPVVAGIPSEDNASASWPLSTPGPADVDVSGHIARVIETLTTWLTSSAPDLVAPHIDRLLCDHRYRLLGSRLFTLRLEALVESDRSIFETALAETPTEGDGTPAATDLAMLDVRSLISSGRGDEAAAKLREWIEAGAESGTTLAELSHLEVLRGEIAAAERAIERGLELTPGELERARLMAFRGVCAVRRGDVAAARPAFVEAERLFAQIDDVERLAASRANRGLLELQVGDFEKAIALLRQSADVLREAGATRQLSAVLSNLGVALTDNRRFHDAAATHGEAMVIYAALDDERRQYASCASRGIARFHAGLLTAAENDLLRARGPLARLEDARSESTVTRYLSRLRLLSGRVDSAARLAHAAVKLARRSEDSRELLLARLTVARVRHVRGRARAAARTCRIVAATSEWSEIGRVASDLEVLIGRTEAVPEHDSRTLAEGLRSHSPELRLICRLDSVRHYAKTGRVEATRRALRRLARMINAMEQDMNTERLERFRKDVSGPALSLLVSDLEEMIQGGGEGGGERLAEAIRAAVSSPGVDEVFRAVSAAVFEGTGALRAFIARPGDRIDLAHEAHRPGAPRAAADVSTRIIRQTLQDGRTRVFDDATADDRAGFFSSVQRFGLRSVAAVAAKVHGEVQAVLYADTPLESGAFRESAVVRLDALASLLGLALGRIEGLTADERISQLDSQLSERMIELESRDHELRSRRRRDGEGVIIGRAPAVLGMDAEIDRVAPTELSVLVTGETGTGKELVARALHTRSHRRKGPFIAVNCGAMTDSLAESELFGHVKGAFSGAVKDQPGLFRMAHGGTLFLDEVGELSPALQPKLLRVLEDGRVRSLGALEDEEVNVRVIAATNRSPREDAAFRDDLYFRLSSYEIRTPPLRERSEDIVLLVKHFLQRLDAGDLELEKAALDALVSHDWPGNVRELRNVVERSALVARDGKIRLTDLPEGVMEAMGPAPTTLVEAERQAILAAMRHALGSKVKAAKMLGISRSTLYEKLAKIDDGAA